MTLKRCCVKHTAPSVTGILDKNQNSVVHAIVFISIRGEKDLTEKLTSRRKHYII